MSSVNPISVRVASKTRFFETTGDSSYYYSNHLLNSLALLKNIKKLGQQLAWPVKAAKSAPGMPGGLFLSKAYQPVVNSRMQHLIDLNSMPGKQWLAANNKLVDYLSSSALFFNSRAVGLLSQTLGRSQQFNQIYLLDGKSPIKKRLSSESTQANKSLDLGITQNYPLMTNLSPWYTSFNNFSQLAKYCDQKSFTNKEIFHTRLTQSELDLKKKCLQLMKKKHSLLGNSRNEFKKTTQTLILRKQSKQAFKTPTGLPFYLLALGLASHCQVLRSSLTTIPIVSGNLQSNLLLADHKKVIKLTSSSGLGLVSASPKSFISRSHKNIVVNYFFQLANNFGPATNKISEKHKKNSNGAKKGFLYNQVFITADLQGLKQPKKSIRSSYASVRWV